MEYNVYKCRNPTRPLWLLLRIQFSPRQVRDFRVVLLNPLHTTSSRAPSPGPSPTYCVGLGAVPGLAGATSRLPSTPRSDPHKSSQIPRILSVFGENTRSRSIISVEGRPALHHHRPPAPTTPFIPLTSLTPIHPTTPSPSTLCAASASQPLRHSGHFPSQFTSLCDL